ncbi:MAG: alpha/beta fold hydrolase [bacterium]|nr:alpha/beta fold hydrolase [bacterium]
MRDQTYHHQALRALNHAAAGGADVSEVLEATRHVRAGDAQGWYAVWTALGDRNLARARATADRRSRGQALLRAHTYYLRAEFFLPPDDPKRPDSFARNTRAFYEGLDTLGVPYERLTVPYGPHHLNAIYYPASVPAHGPLVVFCGGVDSTLEELYFFLVAAAHERGWPVLTFEGPGQGAVLREQHVPFTHEWERPTSAVLDAFLATHPRPPAIVLVGLSLGGYLAPRAAAFDERIDGVVAYDAMYDAGAVVRRRVPPIAFGLRRIGLEPLVNAAGAVLARVDPATAWSLSQGGWVTGTSTPLGVADAFAPFTLEGVAGRIRQDVLLLAGEGDQFVPIEQIGQMQEALVNARSVTAKVYDRASGGAEHSQLGATTLWQADFFDWLEAKFGS